MSDPVDGASIAFFRIAFGLILVWETTRYFSKGWIARYFIQPRFHFTFYGFGWVHPWPGAGMYIHFAVLGILALCVALGVWYRFSSVLLWLAFTYVFLLDEARYLNHFYAASLFAFLLAVIPADAALSVPAWLSRRRGLPRQCTVPRWSLWLLRAQVGLIYFFGGVAKINPDWVHGEPMRSWLIESANVPLIGWIVRHQLELYLFSYGGLCFDLLVTPALLWRRTRPFAFAAAIVFHVLNSQLFAIGIFPWMMLAATTLFFDPDWPCRLVERWKGGTVERAEAERTQDCHPERSEGSSRATRDSSSLRSFGMTALAVYLLLQILIPLRHFVYPGNVSWTEEGHRFSWQMKLREKDGTSRFFVTDTRTGATTVVEPETILESWQAAKMATRPDMILQFAHYLARERARQGETVQVRAQSTVSLNGHESRQLIDPTVDLVGQHRTLWPAPWIMRGAGVSDVPDVLAPAPNDTSSGIGKTLPE
ncbi:MAG TPA: HTTM domain-containing protein [Gemmatimonadaceae bacterium]